VSDYYLLGTLVVGIFVTWLFCVLNGINPRNDEDEPVVKEEPEIKRWYH
jgi:hypothetical protein